jgi:HEPN domain-containing protein
LQELTEGAEDWLDQAGLTLLTAVELLAAGLCEEAITNAFLAMVYAARASLVELDVEIDGWEDIVKLFQGEALPGMSLSKENQRALPIVADLYKRVIETGDVEADPITASACLEDARAFIAEVEAALA